MNTRDLRAALKPFGGNRNLLQLSIRRCIDKNIYNKRNIRYDLAAANGSGCVVFEEFISGGVIGVPVAC